MTCTEFPWLDYIENRLGREDRESAERHLAGCEQCRKEKTRWEVLVREAAAVSAASRLGCPTPPELVLAERDRAEAWVLSHLETCAKCKAELEAVRGIEADVFAEPVVLPLEISERLSTTGSETLRRLASEVLDLVRSRLGDSGAVIDRWRKGVARIVTDLGAAGLAAVPQYGAPESPREQDPLREVEVRVRAADFEVEVSLRGPWVRAHVTCEGAPVRGVSVDLENELGVTQQTATDSRGEGTLHEDLPGRRRVLIGWREPV